MAVTASSLVLASLPNAAFAATKSSGGGNSTLQQGLAFYKGKTITFVSPQAPGPGLDAEARIMAPYFARYLHATVNVSDMPGGDSVLGQNYVANAAPNGLTIGFIDSTPDAVDTLIHKTGVNFNPEDVEFLGAPGASPNVWVTQESSPLTSWSALVHSTSMPRELARTTGTTSTYQVLADAAFNIKTKFVTGYSTGPLLIQGFERGDGDMVVDELSDVGPLILGHKGRPIALSGPAPKGTPYTSALSKVPTLAELAKQYPAKTKQEREARSTLTALNSISAIGLFAAAKTPPAEVQAMRATMKWAMAQPGLTQQFLKEGLTPGWESATRMRQAYDQVLKVGKPVAPLLTRF